MPPIKTIFLIFLQIFVVSVIASDIDSLIGELHFEPIKWDYEEGLRNDVDIYHIIEDNRGVFWFGSTKGLYRFNGSSIINITTRVNNRQGNLISSKWITCISIDKKNRVWFGTTFGLYVYDQNTDYCIAIPLENRDSITPNNTYIHTVTFDASSAYIGTRDGMYQVNIESLKKVNSFLTGGKLLYGKGTTSTVKNINTKLFPGRLLFTSKIAVHEKNQDNTIDTFFIDLNKDIHYLLDYTVLEKDLFFADYKNGVVLFNLDEKSFTKYPIGVTKWSRVKSIVHLSKKLFLINAEGMGLAVFDANDGKYHWLESNRIEKAGLYNLYKDADGYVWYASNGQIFKSSISFPSIEKKSNSYIDIGNTFANGRPLSNKLGTPNSIHLDHTKNNLQLNFSQSKNWLFNNLKFEYQLNNEEWKEINTANKLLLFDLPAGKHNLSIRNYEIDPKATAELKIEVHRPFTDSPLFYALIVFGLIGALYGVYIYNKNQYIKTAKLKSKYEARLATLQGQALRSQINPHFIFNTLNSIKYYSIEKTPEETSDFIGSFSTLIRHILENSKKSLISLKEEIETLRNYTDIEALRFHEKFEVEFNIDPLIECEHFLVPPMIIQPFIENAIWHGLMHKTGNRNLTINFKSHGEGIVCEIIDNGIGRKAANHHKNRKSHKTSLGMKITKERMEIINARNLTNNSFYIEDLIDKNGSPLGTKVTIHFFQKGTSK